jgi:hypothetical protein
MEQQHRLMPGFRFSRKQGVSFAILVVMGVSLALTPNGLFVNKGWISNGTVPNWLATLIIAVGSLVIGTDYELIRQFSQRFYNWIQYGQLKSIIEKNNQARKYFEKLAEEGVEEKRVRSMGNGDFRVDFPDAHELVEPGMRFDICVKTTAETPSDDETPYKLAIGEAVVDELQEADGQGKFAFMSLDEWKSDFNDEHEKEIAEHYKPKIEEGHPDEFEVYATITQLGDHNEIDILDWGAIHNWHKNVLKDL